MNKKNIYTIGYTLFQKENSIDIESLFNCLKNFKINYLVDVRSVPYSKQYPQCNADKMKLFGKSYDVPYLNMKEIGAKADISQDVFSKASEIFLDNVFPIAKSNRPEKTALLPYEEIVDFNKFRSNELFLKGLERIEKAYKNDFTLCLMCSESNPIDCHRYFLISRSLEERYGDWLEIKHIIKDENGDLCITSNVELNQHLKKIIQEKENIKKLEIFNLPIFGKSCLEKYNGETTDEKFLDFCDRYWNLIHGWKKFNDIDNTENYD